MSVRLSLLTISDAGARGQRADRSGDAVAAWAAARGHTLVDRALVPDERLEISRTLMTWCDRGDLSLVLTTGGTGISARDITPEATLAVIERHAPGIAELLRSTGVAQTPRAVLSRGLAGVRGATLIVNLPGATAAVEHSLAVLDPLIEHIAALLAGDTEH